MSSIPLAGGRVAFGDDPAAYAAARPEYPDALYSRLIQRCGLNSTSVMFEIGPGTGLATARLLSTGISSLLAIEPDRRLAAFLKREIPDSKLRVEEVAFEDVRLPPSHFDLGVAATSFHWTAQTSALRKVREALKPGGWWAMWWTHFGAVGGSDEFQTATSHLFANVPASPSHGLSGGPPFALDGDARLRDLAAAGFQDAEVENWRWRVRYTTSQVVRLYRTFSPLRALDAERREEFFRQLAEIAERQFGGHVERPFVTVLYTARRP